MLTEAGVAAEHVEDLLAVLPLIAAGLTSAPLGHLCAAITHVVRGHNGT